MGYKEQYEIRKKFLLNDKTINKDNRILFKKFFEFEEYKLKRTNQKRVIDEANYKTLLEYTSRFITCNKWFKNKAWKNLTKEDIKKVYDDLEDGKIKSNRGKPYINRSTYYNKIFKSKPFELAGKDKIAKEVIEYFSQEKGEVRFIDFEDFKMLVVVAINPTHKALLWLAWDIGENINALLQLTKREFTKQKNPNTKEDEYLINLPKDILKRARRTRGEITNFQETTKILDIVLRDLKEDELVFKFGYGMAKKFFERAIRITKIKTKPKGLKPTWKDLRSGMACHLLKIGWHTDEINERLGHSPSSQELNKYINFLALDKHEPKKRIFDNDIQRLKEDVEEFKNNLKLKDIRIEDLNKKLNSLIEQIKFSGGDVVEVDFEKEMNPIEVKKIIKKFKN
jgi:hypothetical protein